MSSLRSSLRALTKKKTVNFGEAPLERSQTQAIGYGKPTSPQDQVRASESFSRKSALGAYSRMSSVGSAVSSAGAAVAGTTKSVGVGVIDSALQLFPLRYSKAHRRLCLSCHWTSSGRPCLRKLHRSLQGLC